MYLLLGYIRASLPPGFPLLHACRALAYTYVIARIQHCNPVSAGTDGTILCLSYLASLPSCVTIEECQMSGFNTEKLLTITCISIHLTNLFFVLFQHTSCSQLRYMTFCLLLQLGCKDCLYGVAQPKSKVQPSVLVPTAGQTVPVFSCSHCCLRLSPKWNLLSHKVLLLIMYFYSCVIFLFPASILTWWAVLSTGVAKGQMNKSHCCPSVPHMSTVRCIKQAAAYGSCWKISEVVWLVSASFSSSLRCFLSISLCSPQHHVPMKVLSFLPVKE